MPEIWMISNRQPWVEALVHGWIHSKTRSPMVTLPPLLSAVFLHASQATWSGYHDLEWTWDIDVPKLPRGGVCAVARLIDKGDTYRVMPASDGAFFWLSSGRSCAAEVTMVFDRVTPIPFWPCPGALVPTRKLPAGLLDAPGVREALTRVIQD